MKADSTRKRISLGEFSMGCHNLAEKVKLDYMPDVIVAIAKGGSTMGELMATILDIPLIHITIRRDININRMYNHDAILIRWIMSIYHHYLFQTQKPKILLGTEINIAGKKVLIVDDTLHTGATVDIAVSYLKDKGSSDIKIASLAYVSKRKPDFSVLPKGNYCFPWSRDF